MPQAPAFSVGAPERAETERRSNKPAYVQLTSTYAPSWGFGGPVRLMYDYAHLLTEHFDVVVFTGDVHHDYRVLTDRTLPGFRGRLRRFPVYFPWLMRWNVALLSPGLLTSCVRFVRSHNARVVVHVCELRGLAPLYGALLRRLFPSRVRLVHSAFGMLHHRRSAVRWVYDRLLLPYFLRAVDVALAQNLHEVRAYSALIGKHRRSSTEIVLFPLHVAAPKLPEEVTMRWASAKSTDLVSRLRRKHHVPADSLTFIFLGRLHEAKGLLRTIDAFLAFKEKTGRSCRLLIVGRDDGFEAETRRYIHERHAEDSIRVILDVYEERFEFYYLSDVFLGFPTIYEETMLASLEALSCGTPIVVSKEADAPIVEEIGAGHVVDFTVQHASAVMEVVVTHLDAYQRNALLAAGKFGSESARERLQAILTGLASDCR